MNASGTEARAQGDLTLHATLRFAVGVTLSFVASEMLQWAPSFLGPVLAAVLLTNLPMRPSLKMGIGLMLVMSVTALFAYAIASLFRETPIVLFGLIGLGVFMAFLRILQGSPPLPPLLLLISLATIPVVVMVAPAHAGLLPMAFIRSMAVALLAIWVVYAVWPLTVPPKPPAAAPPVRSAPIAMALAGVAIVMPLMLVYLLFGLTDVLPVMIATVMLVANFDLQRGRMHALGMIVGNFAGGLLGLLMHTLLLTSPSLPFLAGLLLVVLIGFGQRVCAGGPAAGVAVLACNAMLIILSTAISSDTGTLALWLTRVLQFALAGAFAVGMMTLAWHRAMEMPHARHPSATG